MASQVLESTYAFQHIGDGWNRARTFIILGSENQIYGTIALETFLHVLAKAILMCGNWSRYEQIHLIHPLCSE